MRVTILPLLCCVNLGDQRTRKSLPIDLHGIAVCVAAWASCSPILQRHLAERVPCLIPLFRYPRDDPRRRIIVVQSCGQLLS